VIGGILEHIEEAGVHSGDAAMVLPPHTLGKKVIDEIRETTYTLAKELKVVGLMNVQYAVQKDTVYILEVNPRASRTIPFVSKAIGVPLAKLAAKVMAGKKLKELGFTQEIAPPFICIKESVLPFVKFPGIDIILGPEMKSTGEVMGIDTDFGKAFAKSQVAAGSNLPLSGCIFLSVKDKDKKPLLPVAKKLSGMKFKLIATSGTAEYLSKNGIEVESIQRISEGRPNILDYMKGEKVSLIINTPSGKISREDEIKIRSTAVSQGIPVVTTIRGALASVQGIEVQLGQRIDVTPVQEWHKLVHSL
jgi:carbamoyl-phosphate synthase large subunit